MKDLQGSVMSGLNTDLYQVIAPGTYYLSAESTVLEPSGLVVTLSQSGSRSASVSTPTTSAQQLVLNINSQFICLAGDLLFVTTSSSASIDQPPSNMIKTTMILKRIT